jgi:hypothetical protein
MRQGSEPVVMIDNLPEYPLPSCMELGLHYILGEPIHLPENVSINHSDNEAHRWQFGTILYGMNEANLGSEEFHQDAFLMRGNVCENVGSIPAPTEFISFHNLFAVTTMIALEREEIEASAVTAKVNHYISHINDIKKESGDYPDRNYDDEQYFTEENISDTIKDLKRSLHCGDAAIADALEEAVKNSPSLTVFSI